MSIMLEDKKLANDILERHFFSNFRKPRSRQDTDKKKLEIFLTGACRANCEYCYIKKNMHSLYPIGLQNEDTIVHNFKLLMDWYVKNEFKCDLELFSAEWLTTSLADKIIAILLDTFNNTSYKPEVIICADNMQFLKDDKATEKVEKYISDLKQIGINFVISASIDGKYCDEGRTPNSDEFYEKLIQFLSKYNFCVHPMISAHNIKNQIKNFEWFFENFEVGAIYNSILLEVRNEDWDMESIQHMIQFCDYFVDKTFHYFNEDKKRMLRYIFQIEDENDPHLFINSAYSPIKLRVNGFTQNRDKVECGFHNCLTVRAGDLSIAPCHRLYYPLLEFGSFNIENEEITDFEPKNVSLMAAQMHFKRSCFPICENCSFIGVCLGHCLGASYEEYRNMMVPQMEVCNLFKSKLTFLIYKYNSMGLFDDLTYLRSFMTEEQYTYITDLIKGVLEEFDG